MRKKHFMVLMGLLLGAAACGKEKKSKPAEPPTKTEEASSTEAEVEAKLDVSAMAAAVGVTPGRWQPEDGAAVAAIVAQEGEVSVRSAGEESFRAPEGDPEQPMELYAGDTIRTGEASGATVVLADNSAIEVAAQSAVAIGDRQASAAPASSAAVLYGVARFTVSKRGPGEGAFLVFAPSGIVAARGTVFAMGVLVTGDARVGVEEGLVEVAGSAELDAAVEVAAQKAAELAASGEVEGTAEFKADDWGEWRDEGEAEVAVEEVAKQRAEMMASAEAELVSAYGELEAMISAANEAKAQAKTYAEAKDAASYKKEAPEWAAGAEATFHSSLRLQQLTYAMAGHGYVVTELYQRHPEKVEPVYAEAEARAKASLLYQKKFHAVVHTHLRPVRVVYYDHHPRGRAQAKAAGHSVVKFYSKVKVKPIPPAKLKSRTKLALYSPPTRFKVDAKKRLKLAAKSKIDWKAKAKAKARPAPYRGKVWYVASGKAKAKVLAGAKTKAKIETVFEGAKTEAHGAGKVAIGVKGAASEAARAGGASAKSHAAAKAEQGGEAGASAAGSAAGAAKATGKGAVKAGAKVGAKVGGGAAEAKEDVKGKAKAGAKAKGKAKTGAKGAAKAGAKAKGKADVKGKAKTGVKGKAKVEVKGKAGADVKSKTKDAKGKVEGTLDL